MRLFYLPIEPYKERYTELLRGWTVRGLSRHFDRVVTLDGQPGRDTIETGRVLDAHQRSRYSLTQMAALSEHDLRREDAVYVDDLFTPGFEALPYIYPVRAQRPSIYVRNHAQSMDVHDFTFPMRSWMRHFELLVADVADGVFCASTEHRDLMAVAGFNPAKVHVVGLPFDPDAIRVLAADVPPLDSRPMRVVYASRWDPEKQPHFFLDVVEALAGAAEFVVCTGARKMRGDVSAVARAERLEGVGKLTIKRACTKADYYGTLATSRALFLSSLQDWVSYSLLDASAVGTPALAPAYRGFPEALGGDRRRLYVPWLVSDAVDRLSAILAGGTAYISDADIRVQATRHGGTLARIAAAILKGAAR